MKLLVSENVYGRQYTNSYPFHGGESGSIPLGSASRLPIILIYLQNLSLFPHGASFCFEVSFIGCPPETLGSPLVSPGVAGYGGPIDLHQRMRRIAAQSWGRRKAV
jgi:hypothetical protein